MKSQSRLIISVIVAALAYGFVSWVIHLIFNQPFISYLKVPVFWVGLIAAVILMVVRQKWPRQSSEWIMRFVCFAFLGIGITFIFLAQFGQIWTTIGWNPSVLGAGISITGLGFTLLITLWPWFRIPSKDIHATSRITSNTSSTSQAPVSNIFIEFGNKHPIVILGLIATLITFIALLLLQHFSPSILQLDVKWIVVACIPLLIALIVGGYISVIKAFEVELRMRMEAPIASLDLQAQEVFVPLKGIKKGTRAELDRISLERRRRVTRLQFFVGRRGYYDARVILAYMHELPNLEYFEIVRPTGLFVCLLPVRLFYYHDEVDCGELERFLIALRQHKIPDIYDGEAITVTVRAEQSIITVLEILRSSRLEAAVVMDSKGVILGLIKTSDIEKRITDEVIFEAKRKKKP